MANPTRSIGVAALAALVLSFITPVPAHAQRRPGVKGKVLDKESGLPLTNATIEVVEGGVGTTKSAEDGTYFLPLAPGRYELRISFPVYRSKRVRINVSSVRAFTLDVSLETWEQAVKTFIVEAAAEIKTEAGSLKIRKKASTLSDSLSAQEMSRSPDSSAAGAVKRVVSATVIGGRYVLVRGLGGRYMTTLLNGVTLPSPEPDKQAVPLDLFPTSLLAGLTVAKSYSAAAPGTFAGGTLRIETNSYPDKFTLKLKVSTGANTVTTGQSHQTYDGGSLGFLGLDDGSRALPDSVPESGPVRVGENGLDAAAVENIAEEFQGGWSLEERSAYPNLSLGATVGDTVKVKGRKLGYLVTANFGRKLSVREADVAKARTEGGMVTYREQLRSVRGKETSRMGGLANVGYKLHKHHELTGLFLYTHTGDSTANRVRGVNETDGEEVDSIRLRFAERALMFSQLAGSHTFPTLRNMELRWQGNASSTMRDEPNTRDLTYNVLSDGRIRFKNEPGSGERFYSNLSEDSIGGGLDLTLPLLSRITLKTGTTAQASDRAFSARRFRLSFVGSDPSVLFMPVEEMFDPVNIGPSFLLTERTMLSDAYDASLDVFGAYAVAEVAPTKRLRLIGGVRYEAANQKLTPGSPFATGEVKPEDIAERSDTDILPAASGVFALTSKMNLRGAYSWTLARPRFRELAPFLFFDYSRRRSVSGNPELDKTRIHNADLRWEWFATDREVFAASLFYKRFVNPIEQVIVSASGGDVSFANAEGATSVGAEFEGRVNLSRLARGLRDFRLQANISVIDSNIELTPDQVMSQTSTERPLQGQSPYVINVGAGYTNKLRGVDANVFYNVFGRRISEVGFDSLPDVYEQPFHRLDLAASKSINGHWKLKMAATNVLNQSVQLKQGPLQILGYKPGVGLSASLTWSP